MKPGRCEPYYDIPVVFTREIYSGENNDIGLIKLQTKQYKYTGKVEKYNKKHVKKCHYTFMKLLFKDLYGAVCLPFGNMRGRSFVNETLATAGWPNGYWNKNENKNGK